MPSHLVEKSHKLLQNLGARSEYAKSSKSLTKSKNLKSLPYIWDTKNRLTLLSLKGVASVCGRKLPSAGAHTDQPSSWPLSPAKGMNALWIPIILRFPLPISSLTNPSFVPQPYAYFLHRAFIYKLLGCDVAKWLARLPACRKGSILGHLLSDRAENKGEVLRTITDRIQ
jgi:hypothetical protein